MSLYTFCLVVFLAVAGFALLGYEFAITTIIGGICAIVCAVLILLGRN